MRRDALVGVVLSTLLTVTASAAGTPVAADRAPRPHGTPQAALAAMPAGYHFDVGRKAARKPQRQWALSAINGRAAWRISRGAGVTVAVIDSGVGPTHELKGQLRAGLNLAGRPPARIDVMDHGTAVASLIAARADGRGISGVSPRVKIVPIRIFDSYRAPAKRVVKAIRWATRQRVDIINLSLVERDSRALRSAVRAATRRGIIIVAGAGNTRASGSQAQYPAAYPGVIAVGAIDKQRELATFSTEGDYVDVVAPGVRVLASDPFSTLSHYSGTSFSTPMVTGVVALMKAVDPRLRPARAVHILRTTARDLGAEGKDPLYGHGLVDAVGAVRKARRTR